MPETEAMSLAVDGMTLGATWFRGTEARAVVLVAGATAVPARFYSRWATDLANRGYDVLTFDYRGVGESLGEGLRMDASMQDWGRRDLGAAYAEARRVAEGRPILLVGHSFGGQALGLLDGAEGLAGGVTVAAGWGWWGFQPWFKRPGLMAIWYGVIPTFDRVLGYVPPKVGLGDGLPGGVATEWARWCRSKNYLLDHVPDARDRFARIKAPFFVLSVSDDGYIPHPAVAELAKVLPGSSLERIDASRVERGLGHFGVFRPQAKVLWDDIADRLDRVLAA